MGELPTIDRVLPFAILLLPLAALLVSGCGAVGKLKEGMPVTVEVDALPEAGRTIATGSVVPIHP